MEKCRLCGEAKEESDFAGPYCLRCEKINTDAMMDEYHNLSP